MSNAPIDFYISHVEKIVDLKLQKARNDALWSKFRNAIQLIVGVCLLIITIVGTYYFLVKERLTVIEIKEVNNPIILDDGTTILRNGTIIKTDGLIIASIDNLIADIADAVGNQPISGVTHYSLFVREEVETEPNKKIDISTSYSFDLSTDVRHPTRQGCYYSLGKDVNKHIAHINTNPYKVIESDALSNFEKNNLLTGCKWLTPEVTSHFVPVDEREIAENLKLKVQSALKLFEKHTNKKTNLVTVNYGRFDQPEESNTLGTCFINGTEMQISIDELETASQKYVSAVVFHELGHCLFGLEHNKDSAHIMFERMTETILNSSPKQWAQDLKG